MLHSKTFFISGTLSAPAQAVYPAAEFETPKQNNMSGSDRLVLLDVADDGVATVTLNNPKALNALSAPMGAQFESICNDLCEREDVTCVVVTGSGRAFSAGGDMQFLEDRAYNSTPEVNTNTMRAFYGESQPTPAHFLWGQHNLPLVVPHRAFSDVDTQASRPHYRCCQWPGHWRSIQLCMCGRYEDYW